MSRDRRWERTLSALPFLVGVLGLLAVCLIAGRAAALAYSHMLYDDKLQNMWKDGSWKAKVDPEHRTRVYNGQSSLEVTLEGKGALCVVFDKGRDLSRHYALVGWINGGSEGGQDLRVFFADSDGKVLPDGKALRLNYEGYIKGGKILPQRWQFFVIPVSHFKLGPKDVTRIAFYNPSEETMPTFYLDDLGFTAERVSLSPEKEGGEAPHEKPARRTPRTAHLIYADALQNDWQDWSWGGSVADVNNRANPAEGRVAIEVNQPVGGALAFGRHTDVDTTGYAAVEFYVNGGPAGGQELTVTVYDEMSKELGSVSVNKAEYTEGGKIAANRWQHVYILLRDLRANDTGITKIAIINGGEQPTVFYVDAVSLVK